MVTVQMNLELLIEQQEHLNLMIAFLQKFFVP